MASKMKRIVYETEGEVALAAVEVRSRVLAAAAATSVARLRVLRATAQMANADKAQVILKEWSSARLSGSGPSRKSAMAKLAEASRELVLAERACRVVSESSSEGEEASSAFRGVIVAIDTRKESACADVLREDEAAAAASTSSANAAAAVYAAIAAAIAAEAAAADAEVADAADAEVAAAFAT